MEKALAGSRGTRRPNPSRETKFSGAGGDRETIIPFSAHREQHWQSYSVDAQSVTLITKEGDHKQQNKNLTVDNMNCSTAHRTLRSW